jgi:hypothetical protein
VGARETCADSRCQTAGISARVLAARNASEVLQVPSSLLKRRREGRVQAAPMARPQKKSWRQSLQAWPNIRPSLRNGLTAYTALSLGNRAFLPHRHAKVRSRVRLGTSVGIPGPHGASSNRKALVPPNTLSSASNEKFRAKSLLKPLPPDGPIYVPSLSCDLHRLPATVDAHGLARGRFHRRAD